MATPWIVLFVVLWVVVMGLLVLAVGLSRRLSEIDAKSNATATAFPQGMGALPIGSAVPTASADLLELQKRSVDLKHSILLFVSPGCAPCLRLGDALIGNPLADELSGWAEIVVVTNQDGVSRFSGIGRTVVDESGSIARDLRLPGTPFAVTVNADAVISDHGLVNALPDVRQLLQAAERHGTRPGAPV